MQRLKYLILLALVCNEVLSFSPTIFPRRTVKSSHIHASLLEDEVSSRRDWVKKSAALSSAAVILPGNWNKANAEDAVKTVDNLSTLTPASLCDPSVSIFKNPSNNRIVYILGTAHISSASAKVAGELVRDIKPGAVFVELDAKRVGRAIPKPGTDGSNFTNNVRETTDGGGDNNFSEQNTDAGSGGSQLISSAPTLSDSIQTDAQPIAASNKPKNPFNIKEKALNKASQLVGNSIKGLYSKLESEGFSAGEEFVVAVKEGLNVGSKIVLGDQDVEVTLRRLTEALSKTDIKKLLAADSEMEVQMKGLMPDTAKNVEAGSSEFSKEEFSYFVETLKAKENVKMLMANLKSVAPEVYQAMVGERDLYMANGLDRLNQFDSIVAVCGIAHVDGIETILRERGWVEVKYTC